MPRYRVEYQDTPFNHTHLSAMLVEAESPRQAWLTAFDALTNRGHAVYGGFHGPDARNSYPAGSPTRLMLTDNEIEALCVEHGLTGMHGRTYIRGIAEYRVEATGREVFA